MRSTSHPPWFDYIIIFREAWKLWGSLHYLLTYLLTYLLIPWCRILFAKLIVTQPVKQHPDFFMKPEVLLPCSQKSATEPYPEPAESISSHRFLAPRHEFVLWKWKYSSTHSLTSELDGGEWSASHPGRPRAGLEAVVKRKIPSPHRESHPTIPIVQPVAQRYTDWTINARFLRVLSLSNFKYRCLFSSNRFANSRISLCNICSQIKFSVREYRTVSWNTFQVLMN
jgi:hypothetical protein